MDIFHICTTTEKSALLVCVCVLLFFFQRKKINEVIFYCSHVASTRRNEARVLMMAHCFELCTSIAYWAMKPVKWFIKGKQNHRRDYVRQIERDRDRKRASVRWHVIIFSWTQLRWSATNYNEKPWPYWKKK